ncbi:response regulator [Planktothrix paucivesiculata]|uniref:histidine kinase n=1 Tax=Planktothrix paucivesiculata PCC 9631 TaxID=671071 RepID=A0A7Z9C1X4_9CYAN|nr:response regulator [Planktothrix paucivesiculata]VXD23856.1 putative Histidine kinase [Planktothrix paucivesiculata PCC 9631]
MNHSCGNFEKPNILVVDDVPDNLRVLSKMLTEKGYIVRKALNGSLALLSCETTLPDIILLDIKMPDMNGYELCQHLKANQKTRDIPIIFISCLGDALDKVKSFEVGGIDYITKPFQVEEVISRIDNQLKLRSLQIDLQKKSLSLQREIEQRQRIQEALESSEVKNLALLNALPDVILRISRNGIVLDYRAGVTLPDATGETWLQSPTPAMANFPDFSPSFIGKPISEILSEDLMIWISHYAEQTLSQSKIQIGEYVQQVNGTWYAYEARCVPSGRDEVLVIVRDISDRKRLEAERLQAQALLIAQKKQIEKALNNLKQAQTQLVQNEKMVSLGQLVAGIAHEINNPINFIYGNISHAAGYVTSLASLIETYRQEFLPNTKIKDLEEDIDLDFVMKDLQQLFSSMKSGSERVQKIVLSLRNFARLDEASAKLVDIHEGIDSTLLLLQHRLRGIETYPPIEVIKEYGDFPKITCYASQLNQVFLHILNNAIDALDFLSLPIYIEDKKSERDPTVHPVSPKIWIRTQLTDAGTVVIRIKDSGVGVMESVKPHLFDPFFTTKPVGCGTGLGLSISYQIIVQQHQGRITCCSSPGEGAEFIIEIPSTQPHEDQVKSSSRCINPSFSQCKPAPTGLI